MAEVLAGAARGSWPLLNEAIWVIGIFCIVSLLLTLAKWAVLRLLIKTIETMDRTVIGADIEIGTIDLNIFHLQLILKDVVLFNPPGDYTCPHVLRAGRIELDVDACSIIKSCGKVIQVEEVAVQNISACMQFDGYVFGYSNVQSILDHLERNKPKEHTHPGDLWLMDTTLDVDSRWEEEVKSPVAFHAARHKHVRSKGPAIRVRKVSLKNISASMGTYIVGASMTIEDRVLHEDFSSEYRATTVKEVTCALIELFLSNLALNF